MYRTTSAPRTGNIGASSGLELAVAERFGGHIIKAGVGSRVNRELVRRRGQGCRSENYARGGFTENQFGVLETLYHLGPGRKLIARAFPVHANRIVAAFAGLTARELLALAKLCRKLGFSQSELR